MSNLESKLTANLLKAEHARQLAKASLYLFREMRNTYEDVCFSSDSNKPSGLCSCPECREMRAINLRGLGNLLESVLPSERALYFQDIEADTLTDYAKKELKAIGSPYAN